MSNFIFLLSICFVIIMVTYLEWVHVISFLKRQSSEKYVDMELHQLYNAYLLMFDKEYEEEEYYKRIEYFKRSLAEVSRLETIQAGVYSFTKFFDMSQEEFRTTMLSKGPEYACKPRHRGNCSLQSIHGLRKSKSKNNIWSYDILPTSFDWRKKGVVTKVVNQLQCQACWAISIVGVMESMAAIDSGKLHRLSSQELIDCSSFNNGCDRGDVLEALEFLCLNHPPFPIVDERDYPLILIDENCRIPQNNIPSGWRIKTFTNECNMDEDLILWNIAIHGPVVAVVNANSWQFYNNGVIQRACANEWGYMNHVVQIVGYNLEADVPYYIVRNSWGDDFGENGYLKLAIHENVCGIANNVAYFDVFYK